MSAKDSSFLVVVEELAAAASGCDGAELEDAASRVGATGPADEELAETGRLPAGAGLPPVPAASPAVVPSKTGTRGVKRGFEEVVTDEEALLVAAGAAPCC